MYQLGGKAQTEDPWEAFDESTKNYNPFADAVRPGGARQPTRGTHRGGPRLPPAGRSSWVMQNRLFVDLPTQLALLEGLFSAPPPVEQSSPGGPPRNVPLSGRTPVENLLAAYFRLSLLNVWQARQISKANPI